MKLLRVYGRKSGFRVTFVVEGFDGDDELIVSYVANRSELARLLRLFRSAIKTVRMGIVGEGNEYSLRWIAPRARKIIVRYGVTIHSYGVKI